MRKTCGDCKWADPPPPKSAVGQRTCRGGPPTAALISNPTGGYQFVAAFPGVRVNDPSCGAFQQRLAIQDVRDGDTETTDVGSIVDKVLSDQSKG